MSYEQLDIARLNIITSRSAVYQSFLDDLSSCIIYLYKKVDTTQPNMIK